MIDYTLPLDQLPDPLPIEPLRKPFDVTITPPGSKSITCRAYVLAALAQGESKIIRPLRADDTDHLLNALCTLGAEARWVNGENHDGEDVYIKGVAGRFPRGGNLYMGEGGTPTRFMIACACLAKEPVVIDASPRMRERPIAEGVDMLRQLGAKIEYVEAAGRLPVRVKPSALSGGMTLRLRPTISSQSISAILLIASIIRGGLRLVHVGEETSKSYTELTMRICREWGQTISTGVDRDGWPTVSIDEGELHSERFWVEPDASSAIYWLIAAAINPASRTTIGCLAANSCQPDALACRLIAHGKIIRLNARDLVPRSDVECEILGKCGAPIDDCGLLIVEGMNSVASALVLPFHRIPDAAVGFAVLASKGRDDTGYWSLQSKLIGLHTLRVKETDRIAALANELRKVGCTVETGEDWIAITPPQPRHKHHHAGSDQREDPDRRGAHSQSGPSSPIMQSSKPYASGGSSDPASMPSSKIKPIIIETYNDHRMAMAFAVLGLNPPNGVPLAIRNPKCVAKSYPGFWRDFARLYG
jgi:3-phosphoshikimate 1-carboxyvinyltransferase